MNASMMIIVVIVVLCIVLIMFGSRRSSIDVMSDIERMSVKFNEKTEVLKYDVVTGKNVSMMKEKLKESDMQKKYKNDTKFHKISLEELNSLDENGMLGVKTIIGGGAEETAVSINDIGIADIVSGILAA